MMVMVFCPVDGLSGNDDSGAARLLRPYAGAAWTCSQVGAVCRIATRADGFAAQRIVIEHSEAQKRDKDQSQQQRQCLRQRKGKPVSGAYARNSVRAAC